MRVLRSSLFASMSQPPLTTVVRDCDVRDSLESIAISSRQPGCLITHDIFDVPRSTSIQASTRLAMLRMDKRLEQNMAVLFFWTLRQLRVLRSGGTVMMDKRAPLLVEDIRYVFDQLRQEKSYDDFTIVAFAQDGEMVRIKEGQVE